MTNDTELMERARELLAAEYEALGGRACNESARIVRGLPTYRLPTGDMCALRAIALALQSTNEATGRDETPCGSVLADHVPEASVESPRETVLEEALQAAMVVIEYAASRLWYGRPDAIGSRPVEIDRALRKVRAALSSTEGERERIVAYLDGAIEGAFNEAVAADSKDAANHFYSMRDAFVTALTAIKRGDHLPAQQPTVGEESGE